MPFFEAPTVESARLPPPRLVEACIESDADGLLLDHGSLPPEFFDLSSRVAGELVRQITLYDIRTAIVVPDVTAHSRPFQDFVREANRAAAFRFFPGRREAAEWLARER